MADKLNTFVVTCHTKKCDNAEASIEISNPDVEPLVICGVCGKTITDVVAI